MNTPCLSSKLALSVVFLLFTAVGCGEPAPSSTETSAKKPAKASKGSKATQGSANDDYDSIPSRPTPFTATQGTPAKESPKEEKPKEAPAEEKPKEEKSKETPAEEKPTEKEKGASTGNARWVRFTA